MPFLWGKMWSRHYCLALTEGNWNKRTMSRKTHSIFTLKLCTEQVRKLFTHWLSKVSFVFSSPFPDVTSSPRHNKQQLQGNGNALFAVPYYFKHTQSGKLLWKKCQTSLESHLLRSGWDFSLKLAAVAPNTAFWFPPKCSPVKDNEFEWHLWSHFISLQNKQQNPVDLLLYHV